MLKYRTTNVRGSFCSHYSCGSRVNVKYSSWREKFIYLFIYLNSPVRGVSWRFSSLAIQLSRIRVSLDYSVFITTLKQT